MPRQGYLAFRLGKKPYAHTMAVADVCRGADRSVADDLAAEIKDAMEKKRFAAIILDDPDDSLLEGVNTYRSAGDLFNDPHVFFPVAGAPTRPQHIFVPEPDQDGTGQPRPVRQ